MYTHTHLEDDGEWRLVWNLLSKESYYGIAGALLTGGVRSGVGHHRVAGRGQLVVNL